MTTQELYDLMSKGFNDIKAEMKRGFDQVNSRIDGVENRIDSVDNRLRNVETDIAELKGRRLAFRELIPIGCAVIAVIVSIIALVK
ncbi:MAG: hypothetical protein OXU27_04375 [Candidatus Poribacteria bacterium]|nr:hypothetical protein [Candidatus Poribacteria bacterium]